MLQTVHPFTLQWVRLFYLYGPGQNPKCLLSQLDAAIDRGDPVFRMSGGEQLRDYLPVEVIAQNIVSLALKHSNNGIVNLCSGKPISIRNLVEGWINEKNWNIKLDLGFYPYPDHEPMAFWGSNEKLLRIIEKNE